MRTILIFNGVLAIVHDNTWKVLKRSRRKLAINNNNHNSDQDQFTKDHLPNWSFGESKPGPPYAAHTIQTVGPPRLLIVNKSVHLDACFMLEMVAIRYELSVSSSIIYLLFNYISVICYNDRRMLLRRARYAA